MNKEAAIFVTVLFFFALSACALAAGRQPLYGHRSAAMAAAPLKGEIESTKIFNLVVVLPLRNQEKLKDLLKEIYDPMSESYRHYLSSEEFTAMFGPTEQDYGAVINHLKSRGLKIPRTYSNRMIVDVEGIAQDVYNAFHAKLHYYERPDGSLFYAPDDEPSLDIDTPISHIEGLDNFILPKPNFKIQSLSQNNLSETKKRTMPNWHGSGASGLLVGDDFRNAYANSVTLTGSGQSVALVEFDNYYPADVTRYKTLTGRSNSISDVYLDGWNSGTAPGQNGDFGGAEVVLDIDMVMCMAPASEIIVYMGRFPSNVLNQIAIDNTCKQISVSWSWGGSPNNSYMQQFALQGQSYFVASGDSGAFSTDPGGSDDNNPQTLVGGTELNMSGSLFSTETAWSGSTGGILGNIAIPSYQQGLSMTSNGGSTIYRNDPDVAAAADGILLYCDNSTSLWIIGGTSCAAPLWAGFTALVNQKAAALGRPVLGFANPALYSIYSSGLAYASDYHDIISGGNASSNNPTGFSAGSGYDLVTGLGSPKGMSLIDALIPPAPIPTPTITYKQSNFGHSVVAPVPAAAGVPVCLYFTGIPLSTSWEVYRPDLVKVFELSFRRESNQCWTHAGAAPGLYLIKIKIDYGGGNIEEKWHRVLIKP